MKRFLGLCALFAILAGAGTARAGASVCSDIADRQQLNVLTINILYTDFFSRMARLQTVADFIGQQDAADQPVDVILLQEVVSGAFGGTLSLSINLKRMLQRQGLAYNLRFRPVAGLPIAFMVGNAMLSRCAITDFDSRLLPFAPERPLDGAGVPVLHEVQKIDIAIPGYGEASIYNTHLCAYCPGSDRLRQSRALFRFLDRHENTANRLIVLGGDFNTDITVATDLPAYSLITDEQGFTDSYALANSCTDCCSEAESLAGCTYAVPGNTMVTGAQPVRIDYLFVRGDFTTVASSVVFNEPPWVSDHSGVLTKIGLE